MTELVLLNRPTIWPFEPRTRAVDQANQAIDALYSDVVRRVGRNIQDWDVYVESEIAEIAVSCAVDNWDGFGAKAVSSPTLDRVRSVASLLHSFVPNGTPSPDLVPEADGEVALSWTRSPSRVFSISIGNHNKLNYAGRLAEGVEPHDVETFVPGDAAAIERLALFIAQLFR